MSRGGGGGGQGMGRGREENHRQSQSGEREGEHDIRTRGNKEKGKPLRRQRGLNGQMTLKLAGKRQLNPRKIQREERGGR